jgi:hypothetical protein
MWARHLYGPNSRLRRRSDRRFGESYSARLDRWRDLVGGAPEHRVVPDVITPAPSDPPA